MVLTNRRIGAEEAVAIGLVTRMVPDKLLVGEGDRLAQSLATGATGGSPRRGVCFIAVIPRRSPTILKSKPPVSSPQHAARMPRRASRPLATRPQAKGGSVLRAGVNVAVPAVVFSRVEGKSFPAVAGEWL